MELKPITVQKLTLKVTPQLITTQHLLQLNLLELKQELELELEKNPALEIEDIIICPSCCAQLTSFPCPICGEKRNRQDKEDIEKHEITYLEEIAQNEGIPEKEEKLNLISIIPDHQTLKDYLMLNIYPLITSAEEEKIAKVLIQNINDDGYLEENIDNISSKFGFKRKCVEKVLKKIQSIEPAGIGARDLKEALLLQLKELEDRSHNKNIAKKIIDNYLDLLGKHKYLKIAKKLKLSLEKIKEVSEFIRNYLSPYPARGFLHFGAEHQEYYPTPDVIIKKDKDEYIIETVDGILPNLRINLHYLELYQKMKDKTIEFDEKEFSYLRDYIERAKLFLKSIQSRQITLKKITNFILDKQKEFFDKGKKDFIISDSQVNASRDLGLSESTISRAISNKFLQLPWGEIVPFSIFFQNAKEIKIEILKLMRDEDKSKTLSDQKIAFLLKEKGHIVARRTVAKYREELRILPSNQRRVFERPVGQASCLSNRTGILPVK